MPLFKYETQGGLYVIESEVWHYKLRIFDPKTGDRVGSVDIGTTGIKSARVADLTLVPPYRVTKSLVTGIKQWLVDIGGYEEVEFERYLAEIGGFEVKKFPLR